MVDLEVMSIDNDTDGAFFEEEINLFHERGTDAGRSCAVCACDLCLQPEL
jgi:hypothetical protein